MAGRIPRRLSFPARHKMSACPNLFDLIYQQGCLFTRELAAEAAAALLFNDNVSSGWTRDGSGRVSAQIIPRLVKGSDSGEAALRRAAREQTAGCNQPPIQLTDVLPLPERVFIAPSHVFPTIFSRLNGHVAGLEPEKRPLSPVKLKVPWFSPDDSLSSRRINNTTDSLKMRRPSVTSLSCLAHADVNTPQGWGWGWGGVSARRQQ